MSKVLERSDLATGGSYSHAFRRWPSSCGRASISSMADSFFPASCCVCNGKTLLYAGEGAESGVRRSPRKNKSVSPRRKSEEREKSSGINHRCGRVFVAEIPSGSVVHRECLSVPEGPVLPKDFLLEN